MQVLHRLEDGQLVHEIIEKEPEKVQKGPLEETDLSKLKVPTIIFIPKFLRVSGSQIYARNRSPKDIDIIVCGEEEEEKGRTVVVLDKSLRLKVDRFIKERFKIKGETCWHGTPFGANWKNLPIFDLALIPRNPLKFEEMNESEFAEEFYKGKEIPVWQRQKVNSPTFAYKAVYDKEPDHWIPGRAGGPEKEWKKGIMIDEHLEGAWFDDLNNIDGIEIRASCEGHSSERVSYIVLRFKEKGNDKKAGQLVKKLKAKEKIYSISDIGMEGRSRIVVAGKTWHGQSDWEEWWSSLADKVKDAVEKVLTAVEKVEDEVAEKAMGAEAKKMADASKKEDKVEVGRFFMPLKTSLSPFEYRRGEVYGINEMVEKLKQVAQRRKLDTEIPPCFLEKKYD